MKLNCKSDVRHTLIVYPESRDDAMLLIALVWKMQLADRDIDRSNLVEVLTSGYISNPESIRRTSAILQNIHPELRGKKWMDRKKYAKDVVQQIREIEEEEYNQYEWEKL